MVAHQGSLRVLQHHMFPCSLSTVLMCNVLQMGLGRYSIQTHSALREQDQAVEEVEWRKHCHAADKHATKSEQEFKARREPAHALATAKITKEREC